MSSPWFKNGKHIVTLLLLIIIEKIQTEIALRRGGQDLLYLIPPFLFFSESAENLSGRTI